MLTVALRRTHAPALCPSGQSISIGEKGHPRNVRNVSCWYVKASLSSLVSDSSETSAWRSEKSSPRGRLVVHLLILRKQDPGYSLMWGMGLGRLNRGIKLRMNF